MTSEDSDPPKQSFTDLLKSIRENAEHIQSQEDVSSLKDRIDSLELLVEEYGQARELQIELREYVNDLRNETGDLRNYRFWVTAFAWLLSMALLSLVFFVSVSSPEWFLQLPGHLQAPIIVSFVTGAVVLKVILIKGVYRSREERNMGEVVPEAVKIGLETFRNGS